MESYYDYFGYRDMLLVSDEFFDQVSEGREGTYAYAIGIAPQDTKSLHRLIKACDNDSADTRYMIAGATGDELAKLTDVIGRLSGYFRYAAILLCVFSIFIFCNFISVSVTHRQKDIGILRALGGSGRDVYAIFGVETMFTCFGIFLVSAAGIILAVTIGNRMLQSQMGITTVILHLVLLFFRICDNIFSIIGRFP